MTRSDPQIVELDNADLTLAPAVIHGTDGVINMKVVEDYPSRSSSVVLSFEVHATIRFIRHVDSQTGVVTDPEVAAQMVRDALKAKQSEDLGVVLSKNGFYGDLNDPMVTDRRDAFIKWIKLTPM